MKSNKNKQFDCILMKNAAQEAIRVSVSGMSQAEEIAFFRKGAADFENKLQAAKSWARISIQSSLKAFNPST